MKLDWIDDVSSWRQFVFQNKVFDNKCFNRTFEKEVEYKDSLESDHEEEEKESALEF